MIHYVDVHLVVDSFDRQFNTWRNIARFFARTDYVMMLDIDFSLCTNFRKAIRESKEVMDKLREGLSAFVVPVFEYAKHKDGFDENNFPRDKQVGLQSRSQKSNNPLMFTDVTLPSQIQENQHVSFFLGTRS